MIRKLKYIIPVAVVLMASCKKQLDINVDPNNPTEMSAASLLPAVQKSLGNSLSLGNGDEGGLSQILSVYTHQLTSRESVDQYGATGSDFYLQTAWNGLYINTLSNLDIIIQQSTELGDLKYAGIAKVLRAYAYSQLVDTFGDVPFSEANKLKEGIYFAKFDKGEEIYPQLISMLDEAIADLNNTSALNKQVPGTDDVIYGGDVTKWTKAANTIKLKLYTQQRLVKDVSAEVNALISSGNLISSTSESFLLPYGPNGATDDRNPGFGDYYASQRSQYISPWFYEILKGYSPRINSGIQDPRLPYYFYNQLTATQTTESGQLTEYRDGGFVSIYFGSQGPQKDKTQQNNMTMLGIYPVGGRYDDGLGKDGLADKKISATSATGAAPYRFITYADRLYLEAELIKVGLVSGDARAKLKQAIEESFKQVDYVITTYVKPSQTVPAVYNVAATSPMSVYVNDILLQYDAKPSQQLEYIMTQKWISSFGSAVDQYTDYRRTGLPVLFNPKDNTMAPGGKVQPPINGNPATPGAQEAVQVLLNRNFPLTLPWYQEELETNSNAPEQKSDPSTYKPFWLP